MQCRFWAAGMNSGFVQRGGWWVVGQFLLMLTIAVLAITKHPVAKPLPVFVGGLVLLVASAVCGLAGVLALGRNVTPFPRPSATTRLVRNGIYRFMRHPLYTSVFCAALGWSLVWHSPSATFVSLLLGAFLDTKARREERWLRAQFPDYAGYEQRVCRFIPWIY